MSPITTDADYQSAIKDLLVDLESRLSPDCLPLTPDQQAHFIRATLNRVARITGSEPHLRGAVFDGLTKMREFDTQKVEKERETYRTVANELHTVLAEMPAARLSRGLQVRRKMALELADKTL